MQEITTKILEQNILLTWNVQDIIILVIILFILGIFMLLMLGLFINFKFGKRDKDEK